MLERIEKLQIAILGLLLAFGLIFAVKSGVAPFKQNSVTVTGSAYEIVTSDSGTLEITLDVKRPTKALAYAAAREQLPKIKEYLSSKGIDVKKNVDVKAPYGYYSYKTYANGVNSNETDHFNLSQQIAVKSDDVEKIKEISLDITTLSDKGIDLDINSTNYSYSKLTDLKVDLLKKATKDAKQRASAMLKSTNNSVGKIQSVKMGVFQITPVDSTDVSDMGISDTSTIEKKITAVSNVTFQIK